MDALRVEVEVEVAAKRGAAVGGTGPVADRVHRLGLRGAPFLRGRCRGDPGLDATRGSLVRWSSRV